MFASSRETTGLWLPKYGSADKDESPEIVAFCVRSAAKRSFLARIVSTTVAQRMTHAQRRQKKPNSAGIGIICTPRVRLNCRFPFVWKLYPLFLINLGVHLTCTETAFLAANQQSGKDCPISPYVDVFRKGSRTSGIAATRIEKSVAWKYVDAGKARWVDNHRRAILMLVEVKVWRQRGVSATAGPRMTEQVAGVIGTEQSEIYHNVLAESWRYVPQAFKQKPPCKRREEPQSDV